MVRTLKPCSLLILLLCVFVSRSEGQQAGSIRGTVFDLDFDVPLAGASVTIADTGESVTTTDQGNYVFPEIEPGVYTLVIARDGYTRQVRANVVANPGQLTEVSVELAGEFTDMEEFVVQEIRFTAGTETELLELRMDSPALMDSISSELMSQAGASDAASALTLIPGTTVQDGKYAVVRGLPDRYVNSQLNGIRLPTADAEKRAVQLDQFPAAAIESVQVSKTFTPDQQGDASGGAVNVVLKGVPDESSVKVSISTSYNDRTSGRQDFLRYEGSGVGDGGFQEDTRPVQPDGNWSGGLGVREEEAPINWKGSISLALRQEFENDVAIGGLLNFFYERDSSIEEGIDDEYVRISPGEPLTPRTSQGTPQEGDFVTSLFDVTQATESVQWGGLGVFGIESEYNELKFTALYTRDASDAATLAEDTRGKEFYFPGYDVNDPTHPGNQNPGAAPYIRLETLTYTERETQTYQVAGIHRTPDPKLGIDGFFEILGPELDWSLSYSRARFNEPDKRQFGSRWTAPEFRPGRPPFTEDRVVPWRHSSFKPAENFTIGNVQRIFKDITEDSDQYQVNLKFPFEQWSESEGYVKFGIFDDSVEREYNQDSFSNFNDNDGFYLAPFDNFWSEVFIDGDHPITAAEIDVDYKGEQDIEAWYWMADIPLTSWFNVIGGTRYERTEIAIVNFPEDEVFYIPPGSTVLTQLQPGVADVDFMQDDILPSIGFQFRPFDQLTFRGNYAETVARQTFRELTPIQQQEFLGGDVFIGNPELQMSAVENFDLRVDYTPYEGGLLSASIFNKQIDQPIEYVQRVGTFSFTTPVNYPEGEIDGVEFEIRQDLGQPIKFLKGLTVGANATFIESEVQIPEDEQAQFEQTLIDAPRESRDMLNAPEYLYNLYFTYNMENVGLEKTDVSVFYTVRGDTLVAGAGISGGGFVPDVYETEFGTLNASLTQGFGEGVKVKLQAKNILDPEIQTVYRSDFIDQEVVKTSYQKGIEYSVGLSASF